jgi:hypothetical protein
MEISITHLKILGIHLIVLKNSLRHLYPISLTFERFAFYYSGLVSLLLALPALVSYSLTVVPYDVSLNLALIVKKT